MIYKFKRLFGATSKEIITDDLEATSYRVYQATCAILLELAYIDGEFSDIERNHIISAFKKDYDLAEEDILELMEASEKEFKESIGMWQFTNLINKNFSLEEKIQVLETVWRVAYSDGILDQHEDYLAHKVAKLLRLSHKQLIDTKLRVLHGNESKNI
jgi:uncharacterized tellurite resistance protein B-like protein